MLNRVPFPLAQGERESPVDYLSRLAFRNGRDDLRLFAGDFRLDLLRVADGDPEVVGRLAALGSTDAEALAREAFARTERSRHYLHKGNQISRRLLSRDRVRACAACLQEDVERLGHRMEARPHRRSEWCIVPIRTCARHGMALVQLDPVGAKGKQDTSRVLAAALPALDGLARGARRRTQSAFESYVMLRLEGFAHDGMWLDRFPLYAVAYICTYLGATDVHGPDVAIARLDGDRLWECEAAGFEIASGGEASVRELLDRTVGRFRTGKRNWAPVSLFGQLWLWLAHRDRDPVYDPLRDILSRHSVDTLPLGPEDMLFGRKVQTRRIHSISSASAEYGIHVRKLRKLLMANGYVDALMAASSDDRTTFDARAAAPFLEALAKGLSLDEATEYIRLPIHHRRSLLDGGLLRPLMRGGTDVLNSYIFRREDLDGFVASLLRAAKPEFRDDPSLADIQAAARRVRCGNAPIVRFLLEGRLKRVGVRSGAVGYQSVLVDPKEVLGLVRLSNDGQMSRREAERELRVRSTTITGLLSLCALEGVTGTRMVGRRPGTLIPKASIDSFRLRYAGLGELATRTGLDPRKLRMLLEADGIHPAFEHAIVAAYYFRRPEVEGWLGRRIGRFDAGARKQSTRIARKSTARPGTAPMRKSRRVP